MQVFAGETCHCKGRVHLHPLTLRSCCNVACRRSCSIASTTSHCGHVHTHIARAQGARVSTQNGAGCPTPAPRHHPRTLLRVLTRTTCPSQPIPAVLWVHYDPCHRQQMLYARPPPPPPPPPASPCSLGSGICTHPSSPAPARHPAPAPTWNACMRYFCSS